MTFEKIAGQSHVCICTECGSIMEWSECYKHDCAVKTLVRCFRCKHAEKLSEDDLYSDNEYARSKLKGDTLRCARGNSNRVYCCVANNWFCADGEPKED